MVLFQNNNDRQGMLFKITNGQTAISTYHTKAVGSNPDDGEVYSIQHYVIHATGLWFSPVTPISSTNKTHSHDIAEILLKVALNTINQTKRTDTTIPVTRKQWFKVIIINVLAELFI